MAEETLEDFYKHKFDWLPGNLQQDMGHFNVFRTEDCIGPNARTVTYSRRTFYKISLSRADDIIHYADKSMQLSGTSLLFLSPHVPYTFEHVTEHRTGFFCIFTEAFFRESST